MTAGGLLCTGSRSARRASNNSAPQHKVAALAARSPLPRAARIPHSHLAMAVVVLSSSTACCMSTEGATAYWVPVREAPNSSGKKRKVE